MDHGAVVTLLVVLAQDLPVRLHHVVVTTGGPQAFGFVGTDEGLEPENVIGEGTGGPGGVDEEQPVPLLGGQRHQSVVGGIEPVQGFEPGRAAQRAVEMVRP